LFASCVVLFGRISFWTRLYVVLVEEESAKQCFFFFLFDVTGSADSLKRKSCCVNNSFFFLKSMGLVSVLPEKTDSWHRIFIYFLE